MFDAKSLIEMMMRGAGQGPAPRGEQAGGGQAGGGLGDILGQLGTILAEAGAARAGAPAGSRTDGGGASQTGAGIPSLEDLMRQIGGGGGGGRPSVSHLDQPDAPAERDAAPAGGGLADILAQLQRQMSQGAGGGAAGGAGGGGLLDILGQVLGQATSGVRDGAQRIDDATGASGHARDAVERATGRNPDDLLAQLKDLIAQNQLGAGAVAGGLGAILLGTKTGRAVTKNALKLGGLALIGGLAYKAIQSWQQGQAPASGNAAQPLAAAPAGSGYEPDAIGNESAILFIRGMTAAAAADGRIDSTEQARILGGLKQAGLDRGAEEFLAGELNNPATVDDLVAAVTSEQEAVQLFTAARVAIDLDTDEEHDFLVNLARGLGLDADLVAHIDAAARAAEAA